MGRLASVLGKGIVTAVLIVLAAGILLAFITMGPQRQTAATLAPIPTPVILRQGSLATPTPAPTPTSQPGQKPQYPYPNPKPIPEDTPIHLRNTGTVPPDPDYTFTTSNLESAIIGVVKSKLPPRWNTLDGKRPPIYWGLPDEVRVRYGIMTPFVVEVQRYIYNPQPGQELIIAMVGGNVGVDSTDVGVGDSPVFEVGETFLAFVRRDPDPSIRDTALVEGKVYWLAEYKHEITPQGRAVNRFRSVDMSLEEVVRRIEAAAARKR